MSGPAEWLVNRIEVLLDDTSLLPEPMQVGWLFRDTSRRGDILRFEYAPDWLTHPESFEIDPLLPLRSGPFHAADPTQAANIFQDCSPDRWGRLLMDRREAMQAREAQRPRRGLRAWDYLTGVDDATRMGALRLRLEGTVEFLSSAQPSAPPATSLRELEAAARLVEQGAGDWADQQIRQLLVPGSSLGGARPKASFIDERGELWLAKFPASDDRHNVGLWEFLLWQLADAAGIQTPAARLLRLSLRGHTFAIKRFDRHGLHRRMYASATTLLDLHSDEASYLDLAAALEDHGARGCIGADLEQLFRRAVFNVLVGHRDDHLRNHGFLRSPSGWRLSPAFDVNPNPDKDAHVLALDAEDTSPATAVLLAQHAFFRLDAAQAQAIVARIREVVRPWPSLARGLGATRDDLSLMSAVIDPDR